MIYSKITVSDGEVEEHYRENTEHFMTPESARLRQIFIRIPHARAKGGLEAVEEKARGVFRQAAAGEDFPTLVRKYSDDPDGSGTGGEMGVIFRGSISHSFESLIFGLKEGSVTEPILSPNGFHIFQVVSYSPPTLFPLEEVRETISNQIRRLKARSLVSAFISSLKDKARIVLVDKEARRGENDEKPVGVRP